MQIFSTLSKCAKLVYIIRQLKEHGIQCWANAYNIKMLYDDIKS